VKYVYPLSAKKQQILAFAEIVEALARKEHTTPEGLARLIKKAYAMNPYSKGKKRCRPLCQVLDKILRDHTPDNKKIWSSPHGDMRGTA
jgi:hypothetical protein